MTEKEIFIAALQGKLKYGETFEFIQPGYDYNVHGCHYRYQLVHINGSLRKEIYNAEGEWINSILVLQAPAEREYSTLSVTTSYQDG